MIKRRDFMAAGAGLGLSLAACTEADQAPAASADLSGETHQWKMVTAWPKNFPGLGVGAENLARRIGQMTGGRISVKVYGGGELVPPFEAFDAVSRGTAQMGHAAAYYWKGKHPGSQFFGAVPFGMTAQEINGWIYHGGGQALWDELYAGFGLKPFAAGNTGVQMGGWFKQPIETVADLKGLKMRIPGLGGEVLRRAGGTPVNLPGAEVFTALQAGTIDATEWVGPLNDLAFGLPQAAQHYYYPGWHEPGAVLEAFINLDAFNALADDLKSQVEVACQAANLDMLSDYMAANGRALQQIQSEFGVRVAPFPAPVLDRLAEISQAVVAEIADADNLSRRVYDSYQGFLQQVRPWTEISEAAYLEAVL